MFDSILISRSRSKYTVWRSILVGISKISFLPLCFKLGNIGILVCYSVPVLIISLLMNLIFIKKVIPNYKFVITFKLKNNEMLVYSFKHWIYQISAYLNDKILPTIVLLRISEEYAAYFSIGYMIVLISYFLPKAISSSFLVEVVRNPSSIKQNFFMATLFNWIILGFVLVLFSVFGKLFLGFFGTNYKIVYLFTVIGLLSSFPYAFNEMYFNYCKIKNKLKIVIFLNTLYTIFVLIGSAILSPIYGLEAISLLMLVGNIMVSVSIFFLVRKEISLLLLKNS